MKLGIYNKINIISGGKSVYKHELQHLFLYYMPEVLGSGSWLVGPGVGSVAFGVKTSLNSPELALGVWLVNTGSAFTPEPGLKAKCVKDTFVKCTTGKLHLNYNSRNKHQEKLKGTYTIEGYTHNRRPVYKKEHTDAGLTLEQYLFYQGGMWFVGPIVGQSTGGMFVKDYAFRPEFITMTWVVFNGWHFTRDRTVSLTCKGKYLHYIVMYILSTQDIVK